MKIALAQVNPTVGDFEGNVNRILYYADQARQIGAELCIFPEQCIPGYPSHDLLERSRFIEQNMNALDDVAARVKGIAVVVGFAEKSRSEWGKGLYNSAALLKDGKVDFIQRKSLLPTYDVFDETRYFDPADQVKVVDLNGKRLGLTICEDVWNDPDFWQHRLYKQDPGRLLVEQGAEIIINIAASPFTLPKRSLRCDMLKAFAVHHKVPLFFVNMIGGNDELVFDGASQVIGPDGSQWGRGKEFQEDLLLVDTDHPAVSTMSEISSNDEATLEALTLGTRDYARKCGFDKALLGLSGGVDSALVAVIGARAFGCENIEAWLMPSQYSSESSVSDGIELAENLGIDYYILKIDELLERYLHALKPILGVNLGVTEENLQARIRGNLLMAKSNHSGRLLLTTGNKSEMATGYCTLYGDMVGGLAVISDVPKTMVYRLCDVVNGQNEIIPRKIIEKPPSAELKPGQLDSDSLPPYPLLDQVIEGHIVNGKDYTELLLEGFNAELVSKVLHLVRINEYKRRQAPPGLKITSKAFGFGRRIPLAQRWRP